MKLGEGDHIAAELMNNEWSRLLSFTRFPADSKARPIRLAKAGFFYNGCEEEAVCFSCGLKNGVWTEDESVFDTHKRLSPHCSFIRGEETANVAIHNDNTCKCDRGSKMNCDNRKKLYLSRLRHSEEPGHANKGDTYLRSQATESNVEEITQTNSDGLQPSEMTLFIKPQNTELAMTQSSPGMNQRYPRIVNESPKHPDYAMEGTRLSSFAEWPANKQIKPLELAKSGFFNAGIGDCVRCFFCGGGLKDWETGDDPWTEHARWFPNCSYVKLCKGETFINSCNAGIISALSESREAEEQQNIPEDWLIENINSIPATLVLERGYSQQDVEKALLFARQKYGSGEVKVRYIMEYLQVTNARQTADFGNHSSCRQGSKKNGDTKTGLTIMGESEKEKVGKTEGSCQDVDNSGQNESESCRLLEENRKLKDMMTCKICMANDACVAFLPCGHLTACVECSNNLRKCAVCRAVVLGTVRVYQS